MKPIEQIVEEINKYHQKWEVQEVWYISEETGRVYRRSELDGQLVRIKMNDARSYYNRYVKK